MQIPKPTDAYRERFQSRVPDAANVEIKAMFGNLGAFVNGRTFTLPAGWTAGLVEPWIATAHAAAALIPAKRPNATKRAAT